MEKQPPMTNTDGTPNPEYVKWKHKVLDTSIKHLRPEPYEPPPIPAELPRIQIGPTDV